MKIFREEHALHNLGEALEMLLEIAGVKEASEGRKPNTPKKTLAKKKKRCCRPQNPRKEGV